MITSSEIDRLLENIEKNRIKTKIKALLIYGSYARGNNDRYSDVDILVIVKNNSLKNNIKIENTIKESFKRRTIDLSIYENSRFLDLKKAGSLFLHHIYDEGKLLYSSQKSTSINSLFKGLNDFEAAPEDMLLYKRMLEKTERSIINNGVNYFDLNMLSVLARNAMIILTYVSGSPKYGKKDVFDACSNLFDQSFKLDAEDYDALLKIRSYYNRKCPYIKLPSKSKTMEYVNQVSSILKLGLEQVGVNNAVDRLYFLLKNESHNTYTSYEIFTDFERDVYFSLNKYLQELYKDKIDSITGVFLDDLLSKHHNNLVIKTYYDTLKNLSNIKKKSTNYLIGTLHDNLVNEQIIDTTLILPFYPIELKDRNYNEIYKKIEYQNSSEFIQQLGTLRKIIKKINSGD